MLVRIIRLSIRTLFGNVKLVPLGTNSSTPTLTFGMSMVNPRHRSGKLWAMVRPDTANNGKKDCISRRVKESCRREYSKEIAWCSNHQSIYPAMYEAGIVLPRCFTNVKTARPWERHLNRTHLVWQHPRLRENCGGDARICGIELDIDVCRQSISAIVKLSAQLPYCRPWYNRLHSHRKSAYRVAQLMASNQVGNDICRPVDDIGEIVSWFRLQSLRAWVVWIKSLLRDANTVISLSPLVGKKLFQHVIGSETLPSMPSPWSASNIKTNLANHSQAVNKMPSSCRELREFMPVHCWI